MSAGVLKPLAPTPLPNPLPPRHNPSLHCAYHQMTGHSTNSCTRLRHEVQDLIDNKVIPAPGSNQKPNVISNPLPNHNKQAPALNCIQDAGLVFSPHKYIVPAGSQKPVVSVPQTLNLCMMDEDPYAEGIRYASTLNPDAEPFYPSRWGRTRARITTGGGIRYGTQLAPRHDRQASRNVRRSQRRNAPSRPRTESGTQTEQYHGMVMYGGIRREAPDYEEMNGRGTERKRAWFHEDGSQLMTVECRGTQPTKLARKTCDSSSR
jgi:hypothetical protein